MTGREAMGIRAIRAELAELNAQVDGPCGVVLVWAEDDTGERAASVVCADGHHLEAVVDIPGDDKPFPLVAFAEALAASQVQEEP